MSREMENARIWTLPFGEPAELELSTEWGQLTLVPVQHGQAPTIELTRGTAENIAVDVQRIGNTVRVSLAPGRSWGWFGGWDCRAVAFVPPDVHARVTTSAGNITVRDLVRCELAIKANAGKLELNNVHGMLQLEADAGSVIGRDIGGFFDVETQAGSVRLDIVELQPGEHRIRASMGSVKLGLARGIDVCIETHTSMGSVRNHYPSDQSAAAKLVVSTEMGSVRVFETTPHRSHGAAWAQYRPERPERPPRPAEWSPSANREPDPELDRILKMVEEGQLSAHDADELLKAMGRV